MIYYTFTTLSTIGFGDYHPCAEEEMILACCVFLSGVSVVSYLMGIFSEILKKFQKLNLDLDEGDQLELFFSLIKSDLKILEQNLFLFYKNQNLKIYEIQS